MALHSPSITPARIWPRLDMSGRSVDLGGDSRQHCGTLPDAIKGEDTVVEPQAPFGRIKYPRSDASVPELMIAVGNSNLTDQYSPGDIGSDRPSMSCISLRSAAGRGLSWRRGVADVAAVCAGVV